MSDLAIGVQALKRSFRKGDLDRYKVHVVRDMNDIHKVFALRAAVFMTEQDCPFVEEFDGNDLTATHLLATMNGEPIATLRLRWFAGFGKVERVCVMPRYRGSTVVRVLLAYGFELSARKGYVHMVAQIQKRLWPVWSRMLNCTLRADRATFSFSDFDYVEIDIPLPAHPAALQPDSDPFVLIRPEGEWDAEGVLERPSTPSRAKGRAA